jgi:predicted transcriptional regulator of viral defense system
MYALLKPLQVREELLNRNLRIFTAQDFIRIYKIPSYSAKYFLETQVKNGLFLRLKQGIYTLKTDIPSEEEIANALYKPSYISFEYALAYYNLIPEMVYAITSATTKPTRLFDVSGKAFSYQTIKKEAFTGYSLKKIEGKNFLIAEKEKALVDYLYFVSLNKSPENDRLETKGFNKEKIIFYSALFKNKKLINLIKPFI